MNDTSQRAKRVLSALRAVDQTGQGRVAGGMGAEATDRLADLDACTLMYRAWSPGLIPGLLQTSRYTADAIKGRTPTLNDAEVARRSTHRRVRCENFLARRAAIGTPAWLLVGEAAIRRPLSTGMAHQEQLLYLLSLTRDYEYLSVQVLPEDTPMGTPEIFEIHTLDSGLTVGHLESMIGSWYTIVPEDTDRLLDAWASMVGFALSSSESRSFIADTVAACTSTSEATRVPRS